MSSAALAPTMLIGRVSDRDPATARVKVSFPGLDGLPSWWLPVVFAKTLHDQVFYLPDVAEHVVCLVDRYAEFGVVIGAIYSATTEPPVVDGEKMHVRFKDGTTVEYDRTTHRLAIALVDDNADIDISVTGNVTINVPAGKNVILGGAGAQQLATKAFVEEVYVNHAHPSAVGLTGPPVLTGTESAWPHVTERAVGR